MRFKLPTGWEEVKLGEAINFRRGHDLTRKNMNSKGVYPVVGSNGIIGIHDKYILEGPVVTIGRSGNVGTPFYCECSAWPHNTTLYIDDFKENDPYYIYYLLTTLSLKNYAGGSAVPTLNRNHLHPISIKLAPLSEQQAIANTLSSLDNKIELNNKTNKNLEEQAQAIFKHWFVDFEFPDENGLPYKSSGGEMVESELGMIPKGWEVEEINQHFTIGIGRTPPRKKPFYFSYDNKDMAWVSIKDLGETGVFISESKEKLTGKSFEDFNIRVVPKNTVLMSFKLTIGRVAITNQELTTNEAIAHFINREIDFTNYLYLYLKIFEFDKLGNTSSIGTAINSSIVKKMPFLNPNKETLNDFKRITDSMFENIENTEKQNYMLAQLRDTLLPKLMSGELRIPLD